jgi:protein-S-isoprenylcysteine O-methyltransferase Ste14
MAGDRSDQMSERTGFLKLIDRARYHEISRQAIGLLLLPLSAWMTVPGDKRVVAGLVIALLGQLFRTYAAGNIFKNKQLASDGAYSLVRHPLYVGNILILGGFTLASGNPWVALIVIVFLLFYYPPAIRYEDQKLHGLFGDDWQHWRNQTGALIPRRFSWKALRAGNWAARQSLLRNGELPITLFLLASAAWLWLRAHG